MRSSPFYLLSRQLSIAAIMSLFLEEVVFQPDAAQQTAVFQAILGFLVLALDIPPLIWHFKHRNFAPVVLISFMSLMNLQNVINALIWHDNDFETWFSGVGLCDVEVKLTVASATALPAATLCILKKLANVMDTRNVIVSPTQAQQRRALMLEAGLCIGIPVLSIISHFICQPVRYAILEVAGCTPAGSETWPTIFLLLLPPILLTTAAVYYAGKIHPRPHPTSG